MKLLLAAGCTIVTVVVAAFQSRGSGSQRQPVQPTPNSFEPIRVGGGVPAGFMILGETQASPPGYTFADLTLLASTNSTPTWTGRAAMPTARGYLAAEAVSGKIFVVGGLESAGFGDELLEYHPMSDAWTARAPMSTPRYGLVSAAVNDNIYAIGGNGPSGVVGTVERYDQIANTWANKVPMPTARIYMSAATVGHKIYVIGGGGTGGAILNSVEEYDSASDTWTARAPMPTARWGLAAAVVDGAIYVIGGAISSGGGSIVELQTVEMYNPLMDVWITKASMPTCRHGLVCVAVNDEIYAIGGADVNNGADELSTVEVYNVLSNSWRVEVSLPIGVFSPAAVALDGRIQILGGHDGVSFVDLNQQLDTGWRSLFVHKKN